MTPLVDNQPLPLVPRLRPDWLPFTPQREAEARALVVTEAKKWVGTPYIQQGDIKGAGIDCSMLLVRCWVDIGAVEPFDPRPYAPNWHMHRSEEHYLNWMMTLGVEVDTPKVGDVAIYQFGRCYSHGGIIIEPGVIISASSKHRICLASNVTDPWLQYFDQKCTRLRPVKYFDVWAKIGQTHE